MAGSSFSVDEVGSVLDEVLATELGGHPEFDPATRRGMEKILQEEEEHAGDIVDLLAT
jgi:curli biogenesis system outer membrane secretion channel CsgG